MLSDYVRLSVKIHRPMTRDAWWWDHLVIIIILIIIIINWRFYSGLNSYHYCGTTDAVNGQSRKWYRGNCNCSDISVELMKINSTDMSEQLQFPLYHFLEQTFVFAARLCNDHSLPCEAIFFALSFCNFPFQNVSNFSSESFISTVSETINTAKHIFFSTDSLVWFFP